MPPPEYLGIYRALLLVDAFTHGVPSFTFRVTPILPSRPWLEQVTITLQAANLPFHTMRAFWGLGTTFPAVSTLLTEDMELYENVPSTIQRNVEMSRGPVTIPVRKFSPFINPRWMTAVDSGPAEVATYQFAWLFMIPMGPGPTDEVHGNGKVVARVVAANQWRGGY